MTEEAKKKLRDSYTAEYLAKTGIKLACIERLSRPGYRKATCRDHILDIAAEWFGVPVEVITSRCRKAYLVEIRRMLTVVMRLHKITLAEIADMLKYDHTAVMHSIKTNRDYCATDKEYRAKFNQFKEHAKKEIVRLHQEKMANKVKSHINAKAIKV